MDPSTPTSRPLGWRFAFGGMLALAMGIGPLAIYSLSALAPAITQDLGLSRTQLGALATASFLVTASLSIISGGAIDRFPPRRVLAVLFLLGGTALAGIGLSPGYAALMVAVALAGLTQALSNPVTNQAIVAQLPAGQRGLTMGVKQSGVQLCQFVAGTSLPLLALSLGWRGATLTMPALAIAGLVLALLVLRETPAAPPGGARRPRRERQRLPVGVWWLAAYSFLIGAGLQATNVYVPLYAFEAVGLSAVLAGATTGVLGGVGVLSRMGWGRFAERVPSARRPLAALALGGTLAAALLHLADGAPGLVWAGVVVHALTALAANVVTMMAVVRSVDLPQVGRASGVLALGLYLGFATGPVVFGAVTDRTGTYAVGWTGLIGVYLVAAGLTGVWARQERGRSPVGAT